MVANSGQEPYTGPMYSGGLVDEEADFTGFESEVNESILFMDRVAAKGLAQKYVPRRLPSLVHMLLHDSRDLNTVALEFVLFHCLFRHLDSIF